ncbi:MAG: transcription-repair coupling factor [Deltaproteobacteria bacterium]|nr:transcription-repair coupling factor [Deltaproteobacteria bacterium]
MARLQEVISQLQRAPATVLGLRGSARAYLLGALHAAAPTQQRLIVVPDETAATALMGDLAFFARTTTDEAVCAFPPGELPYRGHPLSVEAKASRLAVLCRLTAHQPATIIAPVTALLQPVPPRGLVLQQTQTFRTGMVMDQESMRQWLTDGGYCAMPLVEDIGTLARRGSLIDCWPPGAEHPLRIEWEGDTMVSLRTFDPATQRSQETWHEAVIGPAEAVLFTPDLQREALRVIKERADAADIPVPSRRVLQEAIALGRRTPILESALPLLYQHCATLCDYLPATMGISLCDPEQLLQVAHAYHTRLRTAAAEEPVLAALLPVDDAALAWEACERALRGHPCAQLAETLVDPPAAAIDVHTVATDHLRGEAQIAHPTADPLTPVMTALRQLLEARVRCTIVCHTTLAADRTCDLLRWHGLETTAGDSPSRRGAIAVTRGALSAGFLGEDDGLAFVTEAELFGRKMGQRPRPPVRSGEAFTTFQDLTAGDHVVHERYGIGRYVGLETMILPGMAETDFLQLEYLGGDKLYLPVYQLGLLQRYLGTNEHPPHVDRLGGTRWNRIRQKVQQSIRTMAHELLRIYAARRVQKGYAFRGRDLALEEFEATFPYDETPDQWQAIEDTLRDMQAEQPMDRLICGDVGYGKTEVAVRAAYRATADGRQVALLCPTTLLAFQHFQTFSARFASMPIRIELLSRFRARPEQQAVVADLAQGAVDMIIGTHRLFQRDIQIPRLGLLIVDEEQRFGVAHKERLRKLRATVDTLTLSATPIPRTLHMAISGLRDVSIIQTPPADRHAIRTYIVPFDDRLIREAIVRELSRGGQIFFVHNRVQTIASMQDHLRRIVPEARLVVAHGQMEEHALEDAMRHFIQREADLLLCTSIIEAGLDIPAANTLIVNRADTFGLAQLYQIRGRVGRSNVQAAAYLLVPAHADMHTGEGMTPIAQRRLATLARYTELGSGFSIAMHDLELRGAGNLLGAQQSGHIAEIGYELFTRLLERTIRQLRGEETVEDIDPDMTLPIAAMLPSAYIADESLRLGWYKRLASCLTEEDLSAQEEELVDRFGPLPPAGIQLIQIIALRIAAIRLRIEQLHVQGTTLRLRFHQSTCVDPQQLFHMVAEDPGRYQLRPDGAFIVRFSALAEDAMVPTIRTLLHQLHPVVASAQ